jgi:hypothetical protein
VKARPLRIVISFLLVSAFAAPIAAYLVVFGAQVVSEHQRWSEFGSYLAGVYAPIVAVVTLAVLSMQVALQREVNKHQFDQAYIQQARADLEFYITRLAEAVLEPISTGNTIRQILHANFQPSTVQALDSSQLRTLAQQVDREVPRLMGLLFGVFPVLEGLRSSQESAYRLNHTSALQKLTAMLSFETCAALENFHRVRTEGRLRTPYEFSSLIRTLE